MRERKPAASADPDQTESRICRHPGQRAGIQLVHDLYFLIPWTPDQVRGDDEG